MNDTMMRGHTRFIVGAIAILGLVCAMDGAYLLRVGFQSGELLVQIAGQAVAGLLGFLGGKSMSSIEQTTQTKDKKEEQTTTST